MKKYVIGYNALFLFTFRKFFLFAEKQTASTAWGGANYNYRKILTVKWNFGTGYFGKLTVGKDFRRNSAKKFSFQTVFPKYVIREILDISLWVNLVFVYNLDRFSLRNTQIRLLTLSF